MNDVAADAESFRQIIDAAPDAMIVVGGDGRILFANLRTETLFGYRRAELVGKPLDVLIPPRFRHDHAAHVRRYQDAPAIRSMGSGLELFGRRYDGSDIPVEVSLSPVSLASGPAVCAAIRDITERKRIEEEARLNAERLKAAVEAMQDAFALFDADDRLVLCNSVYRHLLGESLVGPIVGRSFRELFERWMEQLDFASEEERVRFRDERLAARRDPTATFEVRARDGRSYRVTDRRVLDGGMVKTIWDLTDDVRLSQELREAQQVADAASQAKSEFLSSMSHELRTPMNAILGFAQLLGRDKREPLSARHRERVDQILRGGEHLLHLIDDILDLSRIEARRISMSREPVDVAEVLEEVRTTLESVAARTGARIVLEPVGARLPAVMADRTRFAQIVMNFGSNAVKYNRPGGTVTIRASAVDSGVRIHIVDTGIGIPAEKQDKLFQPFQRAGQEAGPIEGTGIGLVISKRLAELMGGSVGFVSTLGEGSTFWVELPAHVAPIATAASALAPVVPLGGPVGQAARSVLYVEDNPANVAFMRDVLGDLEGIELMTAPNAEVGVDAARVWAPDIIVMDINLPGMSGFEALARLRAQPATAAIPVIALTAAASERDKLRGIQAGFYEYLTKPVKVDELLRAVEAVLGGR